MTRAQALEIFDALDLQHPGADTELHFTNAFELLVATILSAQSTDQRVNMVTPSLFARFPTPESLAQATPEVLEPLIHATGFFRAKSRSLISMANALMTAHGGQVPADMDALTGLSGVGRKTANVVLGHALGVPGFPVDRHVLRVSNRIGLAEGEDAVKVESQLTALLPPERWTRGSDTLILHGRRICRPKPLCQQCDVQPWCVYFRTVVSQEARRPSTAGRTATPAKPQRRVAKKSSAATNARRDSASGAESRAPKPPRSGAGPGSAHGSKSDAKRRSVSGSSAASGSAHRKRQK